MGGNLLGVDEFYNMWAEPFYVRLMVDVRKRPSFMQNHASTAVHYDPSINSLGAFIDTQTEECSLFDKVVFYDDVPFDLSKPLKRIANKLKNGKCNNKTVFFLASSLSSVKHKYEFMWNAKDEDDAIYPSLIMPDFLYLGEEGCALEKEVLDNLGITHIVSALPASETSAKFTPYITYCQCPLQDISTNNIRQYFAAIIEFIDETREGGTNSTETEISTSNRGKTESKSKNRVLVHCQAGVSRSATLVLVYVMHSLKLTLREAYTYVKQRRGIIRPNDGFLAQLIAYETESLGAASLTLADFDQIDRNFS